MAARIEKTPATRLLTLTYRMSEDEEAEDALSRMNAAWRAMWKRLKRTHGPEAKGYVKVVELTKAGAPHLHIAMQTPFTAQATLSEWWGELTGSHIVDIRKIRSSAGIARYMGKYLAKATETVKNHRKWSQSKAFVPPPAQMKLEPDELPITWTWIPGATEEVIALLSLEGFIESDGWFEPPAVLWRPPRT